MLNRRGFIGSMIGTFITSQLPFQAVAVAYNEPKGKIARARNFVRLFQLSEEQLKNCRFYLVHLDGTEFWAPPIQSVKLEDGETPKLIFKVEDVSVLSFIAYKRAGLVDDLGSHIQEVAFHHDIHLIVGDVLKLTYTLNLSL